MSGSRPNLFPRSFEPVLAETKLLAYHFFIVYVLQRGSGVKHEKLTLRLEEESIARAKRLARERGTSVSRMVASFFESIESTPPESRRHGEITSRLRGSLKPEGDEPPSDEGEYLRYLERKHD